MRAVRLCAWPLALLLTGCGVGASGVQPVEGSPPAVTVAARQYWATDDDHLRGVVPAKEPAQPGTADAVRSLLTGLNGAVSAANLFTRLPPLPEGGGTPRVDVLASPAGQLTVVLPYDVRRLDKLAVGQVVCTAWSAEAARRDSLAQIPVRLTGDGDHARGPYRCDDFPTDAQTP
ncbi:hypothetical protein ABT160_07670 [Streptomyces sp. NPDC001941]|uniref:hypothetical protein n=1 Tax=Streptomyces sp. NPDC001941 TaxID=3154659 RepID=UPI0033202383